MRENGTNNCFHSCQLPLVSLFIFIPSFNTHTHAYEQIDRFTWHNINIFTTPNWWHRNDGVRVDCLDENLCRVKCIAISITLHSASKNIHTRARVCVHVKPQNDVQSLPCAPLNHIELSTKTAIYIRNPFVWTWIFCIVDSTHYYMCFVLLLYCSVRTCILQVAHFWWELSRTHLYLYRPLCMLTKLFTGMLLVFTHLRSTPNQCIFSLCVWVCFLILLVFSIWGIGSEMEFSLIRIVCFFYAGLLAPLHVRAYFAKQRQQQMRQ